jgi:hypothetical protein
VIDYAGKRADRPVLRRRSQLFVDDLLISVKHGMLTVRFRNLCPQALGAPAATIPWRLLLSMAIQIHGLCAFFDTKLDISSAST